MRKIKETKFKTIKPKTKCPEHFIEPMPMEEITTLDGLIRMTDTFHSVVFRIGKDVYRIEKNPKFDKSK